MNFRAGTIYATGDDPHEVYTYAFASTNFRDNNKDTFIYTAASDSQVNLNKMTGFDVIAGFEKGIDKIDLSKVLDLGGGIKPITNEGNSKNLKEVVGDGDDLFMTPATGDTFAKANSIAIITTTEDYRKFESPPFFAQSDGSYGFSSAKFASGNNITLDWVLVDVDGDGDFSAGTDMAIALAGAHGKAGTFGRDGPLTPQDFI